MAYFLQQSNYHYTRMSAKNLLLELNYPTPPYMYLREILRIPAAEPPCVRPRLLMDMTIKYIPRPERPGYGNEGGGYGVPSGGGFGGSASAQYVSLDDKENKVVVVRRSLKKLAAQFLQQPDISKKAKFEYIPYKCLGKNKEKVEPITIKTGDSYLCCNGNDELALEKPEKEIKDNCNINGDAINDDVLKYVFLRSKSGTFTTFESAKFPDKCICSTGGDSPTLALASCNDNTKITEFAEKEEPQLKMSGSSPYTGPSITIGGAGIITEDTMGPYATWSQVPEAEDFSFSINVEAV